MFVWLSNDICGYLYSPQNDIYYTNIPITELFIISMLWLFSYLKSSEGASSVYPYSYGQHNSRPVSNSPVYLAHGPFRPMCYTHGLDKKHLNLSVRNGPFPSTFTTGKYNKLNPFSIDKGGDKWTISLELMRCLIFLAENCPLSTTFTDDK